MDFTYVSQHGHDIGAILIRQDSLTNTISSSVPAVAAVDDLDLLDLVLARDNRSLHILSVFGRQGADGREFSSDVLANNLQLRVVTGIELDDLVARLAVIRLRLTDLDPGEELAGSSGSTTKNAIVVAVTNASLRHCEVV